MYHPEQEQTNTDQKIGNGERLAYAGAAFGQNIIYTFTASYLMFFYTDILGIAAASAGLLFLVARVFDALNDPLMGLMADRTRTRWGKFRPYLLFSPPFIALVTVLCFTAPGSHKLLYAYITYIAWGVFYTVCDIPLWAIPSVLSREVKEKTAAITWSKMGGLVGQVAVVVGGIRLVELLGGQWTDSAYLFTALLIVVPGAVLLMLAGGILRERVQHTRATAFRDGFRALLKNRRILPLMAAFFLFNLTLGLRQGMQIYYTTYVLGDAGYMTWIGMAIALGMALGMAGSPYLLKCRSPLFMFNVSCVASGIFSLVPWFTGYADRLQLLVWIGLGFFCTGVANIAWPALLLDTIADSQKRLGIHSEGVFFSAQTFVLKLVASVSAAIAGLSLSALGYVERAVQTARVITGLHALMFVLPAALFLLSPMPMLAYHKVVCREEVIT